MPCCKVTVSKTFKCDKEGCICLPTHGKPCLCLCENETGNIISCDCKCDGNTCKCDEKCICINTKGYSCICVCRDEEGTIKTCGGCACEPKKNSCNEQCSESCGCNCNKEAGSQPCAGTGCDDGCKCCNAKLTDKEESSCKNTKVLNCSSKTCQGTCQCQGNKNSCVCVCNNEKGELVCCNDCKCDATNTCDKEGCTCVSTESVDIEVPSKNACCKGAAKSCVCVCTNEKGELVCCNDCKCDATNTCDKEGCTCVSTESVDIKVPSKNACCKGAANSCVCVCTNEKGELVCCNDCKCDATNTCNKEGCTCVSTECVNIFC